MSQYTNSSPDNIIELTNEIADAFVEASRNVLAITHRENVSREKGYYGILYGKPSRTVRSVLSLDRELLVLISTFSDQQSRTISTARELVAVSNGRLEPITFIVIHRDPRGNAKLKRWGREQSLIVLPIYTQTPEFLRGRDLLKYLSHELFSHDPFDITGPVTDDLNFYGRREEAINLAKKLQTGQIRSCFGIRKIGKTSIIHRFINEIRANFDSKVLLTDCSDDAVFRLAAPQLINSIATTLDLFETSECQLITLQPNASEITLANASVALAETFRKISYNSVLVFDEIDYITPSSPIAEHWREDFNGFWRNLRVLYQRVMLDRRSLSIFVCGVSSKWFSVEAIGGIENAALAFVPEEYLTPLPRGAAEAMIRRLGKIAGLNFSSESAQLIGDSCGGMPFWIRKACSYIHARIEIGLRVCLESVPQRASRRRRMMAEAA